MGQLPFGHKSVAKITAINFVHQVRYDIRPFAFQPKMRYDWTTLHTVCSRNLKEKQTKLRANHSARIPSMTP